MKRRNKILLFLGLFALFHFITPIAFLQSNGIVFYDVWDENGEIVSGWSGQLFRLYATPGNFTIMIDGKVATSETYPLMNIDIDTDYCCFYIDQLPLRHDSAPFHILTLIFTDGNSDQMRVYILRVQDSGVWSDVYLLDITAVVYAMLWSFVIFICHWWYHKLKD